MTSFRVLSDLQRKEIYKAALDILEEQGVEVQGREVAEKLESRGARTEEDKTYLPSNLVKTSLFNSPQQFTIRDWSGDKRLTVGSTNRYFGTGPKLIKSTPNGAPQEVEDLFPRINDIAKLINALPNFDFFEVPPSNFRGTEEKSRGLAIEEALKINSKPLIITPDGQLSIQEIFSTFSQRFEPTRPKQNYKPLIVNLPSGSALLKSEKRLNDLESCIEKKIPLSLEPSFNHAEAYLQKPVHKLSLALADLLGSITISQVLSKGTAVTVRPPVDSSLNESTFLTTTLTEMAHFLGLPSITTGGSAEGSEAGPSEIFNSTFSYTLNSFVNANIVSYPIPLIPDHSYFLGLPVIYNEIIGMVKRLLRGVPTNPEDMPLDLIHEVGPKGDYLTTEHTLKRFKTEHWQPKVMDRQNYEGWEKEGKNSLTERAQEIALNLLDGR